jgi:peptidoglycan/LPS O-acetylase OafA/YrhL
LLAVSILVIYDCISGHAPQAADLKMLVQAKADTAPRQREFIVGLESLRGIAALSVALFHSFNLIPVLGVRVYEHRLWDVPSGQALLMHLIMVVFNGGAAVSLFFVLSGFVLALSLRRDKRSLPVKGWAFLMRRFIRIYPSLAVNILTIFVAVAVLRPLLPGLSLPQFSATQLRDNLLLQAFPINGATWSLMIELVAVPFIFFGFCVSQRWGLRGLRALMLAATAAIFLKVFLFHLLIDEFAFMFFVGMVIAELWMEQMTIGRRTTIRMVAIAVPVLLLARSILGYNSKYSELVEGYAAAVLVAAVVLGPRSALHGILEMSIPRFLGSISYSFYLYHPLALYFAFAAVATSDWMMSRPLIGSAAIALVSVAITIPLGCASFSLTERPMIWLSRRF